jgi:hypothetical protein
MSIPDANAYPNSDNYPDPSFRVPIPPPAVDPDQGELIRVEFSREWLPYIQGAIDQLLLPSTWQGSDFDRRTAVARADTLKHLMEVDVPQTLIRYNPLTCTLEQSLDGGESYDPVPGYEFQFTCEIEPLTDQFINNVPAGQQEAYRGRVDWRAEDAQVFINAYRADNTLVAQQLYAGGFTSYQFASISPYGLAFSAGGTPVTRILMKGGRVGIGDSSTPPSSGAAVQVRSATQMPLSALALAAGLDLLALYSSDSVQRFYVTEAGLIKAGDYERWAQSSTGSLRKQFGLEGIWSDDTDAIRKGGARLEITDYVSDAPILTADFDTSTPALPRLSFFYGAGAYPDDGVDADEPDLPTYLLKKLNQYGLTNRQPEAEAPAVLPNLLAWEKCNAAYYVATRLSEMVLQVLDLLAEGTDLNTLTALLVAVPWNFRFDLIPTVVFSIQSRLAQATGMAVDMADVDTIAAAILDGDFALPTIGTELAGSGFISDTVAMLNEVLAVVYADKIDMWLLVGKFVPAPACGLEALPCQDRFYYFGWGNNQGWSINQGNLVFGQGVTEGYNDPFYGVFIEGQFDSCLVKTVEVGYYATDTVQAIQLWPYVSDGMGGYTLLGLGYGGAPVVGHNALIVDFPGDGYTIDLLIADFESETVDYGNYIKYVQITLG